MKLVRTGVFFLEIKIFAIVRVVNAVIKLRIMRVQYVLEPYFSFLSVSTSVPKKLPDSFNCEAGQPKKY